MVCIRSNVKEVRRGGRPPGIETAGVVGVKGDAKDWQLQVHRSGGCCGAGEEVDCGWRGNVRVAGSEVGGVGRQRRGQGR